MTRGRLASALKNLDEAAEIFISINREHDAAKAQVAKLYALALLGEYERARACDEGALLVFKKYGDELARSKVEKNLGNIVASREDNRRAEKYYLAARRRFLKLADAEELAMNENSLANTYAELNHLACHARFRADNPLFSSLHLADGFVIARDVLKQNLRAELVTLSACETGLNEISAGEEILGLSRGFLSAGAVSLVLGLWTVGDEATARLMRIFTKICGSEKPLPHR